MIWEWVRGEQSLATVAQKRSVFTGDEWLKARIFQPIAMANEIH